MAYVMKTIQHNERRFGVIAVEKGIITKDQLFDALKTQVQDELDKGTHQLLGEILHRQGAMTWAQIGEVLIALGVIEGTLSAES